MRRLSFFLLAIFSLGLHAQTQFADSIAVNEFKKRTSHCSLIGLGEVGHGYESINEAKSAMTTLLQLQMDVAAISFESSFTGSVVGFLSDRSIDDRAKRFLYPFWNTASVKAALQPFLNKETGKPLVVGFDIQEDCRFGSLSKLLLHRKLVLANKEKLLYCDSVLRHYIGENFDRKGAMSSHEYTQLSNNYTAVRKEVEATEVPAALKTLLSHCLINRMWLCRYLTLASAKERMFYRDSLMAVNIAWLKQELFPGDRLIIWSANTHVAKGTDKANPKWMGEWLSSVYGDAYFAMSFEKGRQGDAFLWEQASYKYHTTPRKKFDLTIYLISLLKIRPEEWETPCN